MAGAQGRRTRRQGAQGQVELRVAAGASAWAARILRASAREWARRGEQLSLSLVTDGEMRRLNRGHRQQDRPTDVLSWEPGEIVISLDTARRQAREGGWSLRQELRRLLAHGLAHCRGHDHQARAQAARMAAAERRMLGEEGMVGESLSERRRASRLPVNGRRGNRAPRRGRRR